MTEQLARAELVAAKSVAEGDEIHVGRLTGYCVVVSTAVDERGLVRLTYIKRGEWARAGARVEFNAWLVECGLKPLAVDELVLVRRGDPDRADELRLAMQYEFEDRLAS